MAETEELSEIQSIPPNLFYQCCSHLDPILERQKELIAYDPNQHDYSTDTPEIRNQTWALCLGNKGSG